MVNLTRIYTRLGDDGTTNLGDMSRIPKTDTRLAAYADVNEANAAIGVALALGDLPEDIVAVLTRVQNDLFDVGADLCTPVVADPEFPPLRIEPEYVERLEQACDTYLMRVEKLRSFILPGGTPGAALLHQACTVVRRAERSTWAALDDYADTMNAQAATYLNRLSDLLFILARVANVERGDVLWEPGANSLASASGTSMWAPGGAASSQDRKPVSAAALIASSTDRPRLASTRMTASSETVTVSVPIGARRSTISSSRRHSDTRGASEKLKMRNQSTRSPSYRPRPSIQPGPMNRRSRRTEQSNVPPAC